ncbi:MAG: spore coat protein [Defluviitaleaceae bacterium]|nr:spore coat protein [Defluviitaleaceae bacterium]
MSNFNQMELSSIREVVSCHIATSNKLASYANQCSDPHIKQMFQQAAGEAQKSAQKLTQMLQ